MSTQLEIFDKKFSQFRLLAVAAGLYKIRQGRQFPKEFEVASQNSLGELLQFPVSKKSSFFDSVWDFTEDHKGARTLSNSRMTCDFSNWSSIPLPILSELKVAALYAMNLPQRELAGKRATKNEPLTVQTVLPMIKTWMAFMSHVCEEIALQFGVEFLYSEYSSLSRFKLDTYLRFSRHYKQSATTSRHIEQVFRWFSSARIVNSLFETVPVLPTLYQLELEILEVKEDKREKIMDVDVFEKVVAVSGYIVTTFLKQLGLPINDAIALRHCVDFHFPIPSEMGFVNKNDIERYRAVRLYRKGLRIEETRSLVDLSLTGDFLSTDLQNADTGSIYEYTKIVHEAASYLVGQFTGMRPSELLEVRTDSPLVDSFGIPCLTSKVHKKRSNSHRLFDDLWVAIPAVQDALTALTVISHIKNNPYVFSRSETTLPGIKPRVMSAASLKGIVHEYFVKILNEDELENIDFFPYMLRHTLAYQLFIADLGLPFISHQLKHFGNMTQQVGRSDNRGYSLDTLGYGDIGDMLAGEVKSKAKSLRHKAEVTAVKAMYDPDATYAGVNGEKHKARLQKFFQGYQAAGFTKVEIFEAMAEQGITVINVGTGMCYGGREEDFDESLPCIGSLRCNPNRCPQAVVTKLHAPKWREVYEQNINIVDLGPEAENYIQANEAAKEAKGVLEYLGEY